MEPTTQQIIEDGITKTLKAQPTKQLLAIIATYSHNDIVRIVAEKMASEMIAEIKAAAPPAEYEFGFISNANAYHEFEIHRTDCVDFITAAETRPYSKSHTEMAPSAEQLRDEHLAEYEIHGMGWTTEDFKICVCTTR